MKTKAVILAGGLGKRFHPFSLVIPKPLIPIGKDPILLNLINKLKAHGVEDCLISLGYQAELIEAFFGNGEKYGVKIEYFKEDMPLGTAGPLKLMAEAFKEDEYFVLVNGDIYTELDFSKMINFAEEKKADIVVGHIEKNEKSKYGEIIIEEDRILEIKEKPERSFMINSGIYVLNSNILEFIPKNKFFTMVDLINLYLEKGKKVSTYKIEEYWLGIEDADGMKQVTQKLNNIPEE